MGKYRTKSMYICPYCHIVGWQRTGQFRAHIKKSHPGKDAEYAIKNWFKLHKERYEKLHIERYGKK